MIQWTGILALQIETFWPFSTSLIALKRCFARFLLKFSLLGFQKHVFYKIPPILICTIIVKVIEKQFKLISNGG